jgi:hypothetical protein
MEDALVAELNAWGEKWEKCTPALIKFLALSPETRTAQMKAAASCTVGELLRLVRDPLNKLGYHTIRFVRSSGEECGIVDAEISFLGLADDLDRGALAVARVVSVMVKEGKPQVVVAIAQNSPPAPKGNETEGTLPESVDTPAEKSAWVARWDKTLYTRVAGVNYSNDDGSSRQEIVSRCRAGEILELIRDPNNPHSPNRTAIKIMRHNGEMLGHVPSAISEIMADQMDRGSAVEARIIAIKGGTLEKPTLGVNIVIGQNHAPRRKQAKPPAEKGLE